MAEREITRCEQWREISLRGKDPLLYVTLTSFEIKISRVPRKEAAIIRHGDRSLPSLSLIPFILPSKKKRKRTKNRTVFKMCFPLRLFSELSYFWISMHSWQHPKMSRTWSRSVHFDRNFNLPCFIFPFSMNKFDSWKGRTSFKNFE